VRELLHQVLGIRRVDVDVVDPSGDGFAGELVTDVVVGDLTVRRAKRIARS
jgi:hypothetical protein